MPARTETLAPADQFAAALRHALGAERYGLWFDGHAEFSFDRDGLLVAVANRFFQEWLEGEFLGELVAATRTVTGKPLPVRFRIDAKLFQAHYRRDTDPAAAASPSPPAARTAPAEPAAEIPRTPPPSPRPAPSAETAAPAKTRRRPRYALENFVVGTPNRMAHAAARALVEQHAAAASPMFLYGGGGLGKTHLLRGVELALKQRRSNLKALCCSCEEFANEFVAAYRENRLPAFRKKIRSLDLLILDDVQFLAGKKATQEELLHAFEAIHHRGGKILLAADAHPRRLAKVTEDLKSRFVAGLVAKLEPPTRDLRRQLVAAKAAERGLALSEDVVKHIADSVAANVRELEGALNYLECAGVAADGPLDLAAARGALAEVVRHTVPALDLPAVLAKAIAYFGLAKSAVLGKSRARTATEPRALLVHLARRCTDASFKAIGAACGGMAHSSALAADKRFRQRLADDRGAVLGDRNWKLRDAVEAFLRDLGIDAPA